VKTFLRTLRKIYGAIMENGWFDDEDSDDGKLGRPTISAGRLGSNRDAILNMLCPWWPNVGWQLATARTREDLRQALQPATVHGNRQHIDRLLRITNVTASAPEIRKKRLALGDAVEVMHNTQAKKTDRIEECREIEVAWSQAKPDQLDFVKREFPIRRAACQEAQDQAFAAEAKERTLESELLDMEAAYAQDEMLMFITKAKYALNPLNIANAMAGLPNAIDVPFLGAWQSHARCSKLECSTPFSFHYELFETIQSIWERSKTSSLPVLEFFQQEIMGLPKTMVTKHPTMGTNRVDNYVKSQLCENWWYLQRAIEKSLQTNDDPRPVHFIIAANFDKLLAEPRTYADLAMAKAGRLCD
jgi:hypothetical protein